jgi:riboflavin kinase/FMN adenylyltransferase
MRVFSDYQGLPADATGAVVALGNFDGVHRGHQALLAAARADADALGAPLAVLTFEPHPRSVFKPDEAPFRLTTPAEKARLLQGLGVDLLYVLPFDEALSRMSAGDFRDRVLIQGLAARAIVAGPNFRFGYRRAGTLETLAEAGLKVITPPVISDEAGRQISSSLVREALTGGKPQEAARLLGRWWTVDYTVETGDRRGRELGYPTANGRLGPLIRPAFGIYAVMAQLADGRVFPGAANIGVRPMWQSALPLVETYLFDMAEDIYGHGLRIDLIDYLRPEAKFADIESLKDQMAKDCAQARIILSTIDY